MRTLCQPWDFWGVHWSFPGQPLLRCGENPRKRWRVVGEPPRSSWTENLSWYYASANPLGEPPRNSWIEAPYHGTTNNLSLFWFVGHAYLMLVTTATTTIIYFLKSVYFFPQRTRKGLLWTFIECKRKSSIFVMKLSDTSSQIPNAPTHVTNGRSKMKRHHVRHSKKEVRQPKNKQNYKIKQ